MGPRIVVQGRYCDVVLNPGGMASCCVPCPIAPWKYGDGKSLPCEPMWSVLSFGDLSDVCHRP